MALENGAEAGFACELRTLCRGGNEWRMQPCGNRPEGAAYNTCQGIGTQAGPGAFACVPCSVPCHSHVYRAVYRAIRMCTVQYITQHILQEVEHTPWPQKSAAAAMLLLLLSPCGSHDCATNLIVAR
eukprot:354879-Chlamydomonas_euryale.AAC.9